MDKVEHQLGGWVPSALTVAPGLTDPLTLGLFLVSCLSRAGASRGWMAGWAVTCQEPVFLSSSDFNLSFGATLQGLGYSRT